MIRYYIIMYVFCLITSACNQREKNNQAHSMVEVIEISSAKFQNSFNIEKLSEKSSYISLPENDGFEIGKISDVKIYDDWIFVVDNEVSESIFIYNMISQESNVINKKGNGPGEYLSIKNIEIDTIANKIHILDSQGELLIYDFQGKFSSSISCSSFYFKSFTRKSNGNYLGYPHLGINETGNYDRIVELDSEGNLIESFGEQYMISGCMNHSAKSNFAWHGDKLLLVEPYVNTIYEIDNQNLKEHKKINFGQFNNTIIPTNLSMREFLIQKNKSKKAFFEGVYFESTKFFYVEFSKNRERGIYFSLKDHNPIVANFFCDEFNIPIQVITVMENKMICYIDPIILPHLQLSDSPEIQHKYGITKESFNPLIVIYEF